MQTSHVTAVRVPLLWTLIAFLSLSAVFGLFVPQALAADNALVSMTMLDTDADGKIDRIQVSIDNDSVNTAAIHDTTGWSATDGGDAVTISAVAFSSAADADPIVINVDLDDTDADLTTDTANSDLELLYTQQGADAGTEYNDGADTQLLTINTGDAGTEEEVDNAAPVVLSVSPSENSYAGVTRNIVITFSEAMDTTFAEGTEFAVSPDPGTLTETWTVGDTVVTLDNDVSLLLCTTYSVTTDTAEIDAAAGSTTTLDDGGPEDGDWSFYSTCGDDEADAESPTYTATVTSPNGGESLTSGTTEQVTWSTGGTGNLSYADLSFSSNGGSSWTTIVTSTTNDGSYDWMVPEVTTTNAMVRVQAHNNLEVLATDTSDAVFSITNTGNAEEEEETPEDTDTEVPDGYGYSPVDGTLEEITDVSAGDYITSPSFRAVYYVDSNLNRHPFFDTQTYATWQKDFTTVKTVTDATLPTLPLGSAMLPKPGTVWVKIQSVNKVYLIQPSSDMYRPTLRWITTEELAESYMGSRWADYIIDVDVSLFNLFDFGPDITDTAQASVDAGAMRTRASLGI